MESLVFNVVEAIYVRVQSQKYSKKKTKLTFFKSLLRSWSDEECEKLCVVFDTSRENLKQAKELITHSTSKLYNDILGYSRFCEDVEDLTTLSKTLYEERPLKEEDVMVPIEEDVGGESMDAILKGLQEMRSLFKNKI